ncbi:MAG: hypothetical protein OXG47_02205 [bacterium]|nr:hypothetical protein [bacterium]
MLEQCLPELAPHNPFLVCPEWVPLLLASCEEQPPALDYATLRRNNPSLRAELDAGAFSAIPTELSARR